MNSDQINVIFKEPTQWGLRGDPQMWDALKEFALKSNPANFMNAILSEFNRIIENGEKNDRVVFIKVFAIDGMTSGNVSIDWFNETGFPLLKGRYEKVTEDKSKITGETAEERRWRHERIRKQLIIDKKEHPERFERDAKFTTQSGDWTVTK